MFTEVTLSDNVKDFLSSLNRPIRVLRGQAWAYAPPRSWRGAAGANNTTLADCEQNGLTIVSWAADQVAPAGVAWVQPWSGSFFEDSNPRDGGSDWVVPDHNGGDDTFITPEGNRWARTAERVIWFTMDLENLPADIDTEKFFGPPIRRALSDHYAEERRRAEDAREAARIAEEERRRTERARATAAARERFIRQMGNSAANRLDELQRFVSRKEGDIRSYEQYLASAWTALREAIAEAKLLEEQPAIDEEQFNAQWEHLVNHPKIEEVSIEGDYLVVSTVPLNITCPDSGESGYLGKMQVKIPSTTNRDVLIVNTDNSQYDSCEGSNRDHPHVMNQHPCWGDAHNLQHQLRSENQIPAFVELAFQYLESYNPEDSWGRTIDLWLNTTADDALAAREGGNVDETQIEGYRPDADCNCYDCRAEYLGYDPAE